MRPAIMLVGLFLNCSVSSPIKRKMRPAIMLVGWVLSDKLTHPVCICVKFACTTIIINIIIIIVIEIITIQTEIMIITMKIITIRVKRIVGVVVRVFHSHRMPVGSEAASSCWTLLDYLN